MEIVRPVGTGFRKLLDRCGTDLECETPLESLLQDRIDLIPLHQIEPGEVRSAWGACPEPHILWSACASQSEVKAGLIKLVALKPCHDLPPWNMSLEQTVSRLSHDIVEFAGILPLQRLPTCDQYPAVAGSGASDRNPTALPVQVAVCQDGGVPPSPGARQVIADLPRVHPVCNASVKPPKYVTGGALGKDGSQLHIEAVGIRRR